jgi:hypothetical protein
LGLPLSPAIPPKVHCYEKELETFPTIFWPLSGIVAYKLNLPADAQIHPVLGQHFTLLPTLPLVNANRELRPEPKAIMDNRMIKHRGRALTEVLIQWKGALLEEDT